MSKPSRAVYERRLALVRRLLKQAGCTHLVVPVHEGNSKNVFYLSGFKGTTGVLVVSNTKTALAVDGRYRERAKRETEGVLLIDAEIGSRDAYLSGYARAALRALRAPEHARVGFEGMRLPTLVHAMWKRAIPYTLLPTKNIVETVREVKDEYEIRALAEAARRSSAAFKQFASHITHGKTERELADLLEELLVAHGAVRPSFDTIVASGPNAALPHHETGTRKLASGESVIIDFGGIFSSGYCSDISRTVFVPGKGPHPKLIHAYHAVDAARRAALKVLTRGATWKSYDAAARDYLTREGFGKNFLHGVGHSLGLEVHDPYDYTHPFREGVVMTDEPGVYLPGLGGVRIEDDVVITNGSPRVLSSAPLSRYH